MEEAGPFPSTLRIRRFLVYWSVFDRKRDNVLSPNRRGASGDV